MPYGEILISQVERPAHSRSEMRAWFVWSFGALFYLYQFVLRNSPGVMKDYLMCDLCVEACALGILSAFYLISYSILQIPIGLGMDTFGPTRLLRVAVVLCVLGIGLFCVSESFYLACFSRLLMGAGSACAFLGSLKLATCWFPPEKLALVVGYTMLAGTFGATFGQAPLAYLINIFGWRQALLYVVVPIGLLLAGGIWLFVKDTPPGGPLVPSASADTTLMSLFKHLKEISVNYQIWALGLYGALMYFPILAFVDLWGISFLMKLYDIDNVTAGSITTMYYIGIGVGSPVMAILSDYFRTRKVPMIIGAFLSIFFNGLIIYMPNMPFSAMYGLLFAAGVAFSVQPLIFASVCQLTSLESNGTVISFTNMIVMILGLVIQPLIGWVLDLVWTGIRHNGIPHYEVVDYQFALLSLPLSLVFVLLLMPFIPETFPQLKSEKP